MQLEINLNLSDDKPVEKVKESTYHRFIVDNFLVDYRKNSYIYQLKIAKKLFAIIPDFDFWKWVSHEVEKVYTLKDFLHPDKIRWLRIKNKKRKLDMRPTKTYPMSSDCFYEVKPSKKKLKTKLDFLNYEPDED